MTFEELMAETHADSVRWFGETHTDDVVVMALGLCGESGEVADEIKKVLRGDRSLEEAKDRIATEMIDVLVYWLHMARILGIDVDATYAAKRAFNDERFSR